MFKCNFCGKEFDDVDEYVKHIQLCAEKYKAKKADEDKARMEKSKEVNEYVETIKSIKKTLESKKAEFKAKFPLEYKMNFGGGDSIFSGKINDKSYDKEDDFYHDLLNCWWK